MQGAHAVVYLENHALDHDVADDLRTWLRSDESPCFLVEASPHSRFVLALRELNRDLNSGDKKPYEYYLEKARRSEWFWEGKFRRAYLITSMPEFRSLHLKIIGVDPRLRNTDSDIFAQEDVFFEEQVFQKKNTFSSDIFEKYVIFFREHAFYAWFVAKRIREEAEKDCRQFIFSSGSLHFASLARYLQQLQLETVFVRLPVPHDDNFRIIDESEEMIKEHLVGGDKESDAYNLYQFFLGKNKSAVMVR